jgi:dTDP-4-dehydrorhamnose reductase
MRVLITGAAGQLGRDLADHCEATGDEVTAFDRGALDVGDRDQVLAAVMSSRPDVVVNAAAWTAVDACESDPDRAYRVNALAVRWLREACERGGAHLVHVSTDYVFDGSLDRPYHEWDTPNPQSAYGASKLAGEREVRSSDTVVRTSWVCGEHGNNMVKTVLRLLETHDSLSFVDDQVGCPTFCADLAVTLRQLAVGRRSGIHHVTNQGAVSWYEFVGDIVVASGRDRDIVKPIATADLHPPRPAPRPANSVLDNAVLRLTDLPLLRHYSEPLSELVHRIQAS